MASQAARRSTDSRLERKSDSAYKTISEVAGELNLPQHVLRFWESKFPQINPMKRGGGRRYYRPEDLMIIRRIQDLLYNDGYTIKGVQKLMRDNPKAFKIKNINPKALSSKELMSLKTVVRDLEGIRKLLS